MFETLYKTRSAFIGLTVLRIKSTKDISTCLTSIPIIQHITLGYDYKYSTTSGLSPHLPFLPSLYTTLPSAANSLKTSSSTPSKQATLTLTNSPNPP
jgi:hypothetical protein